MSIKWSDLRWLGNSTLVKSNYLWIFVIPIFIKVLNYIEVNHQISFELPLKLTTLFYSSIFFMLGSFTYTIRCPKLIKENGNYNDFLEKGMGMQQLVNYFYSSVDQILSSVSCKFIESELKKHDNEKECSNLNLVTLRGGAGEYISQFYDESKLRDSYWNVTEVLDTKFTFSRYICLCMFSVGIGFLLWTAGLNVILALKFIHGLD
ncbi:hypothetical protein [Pseudoalteromonas sp. R86517]|uniref:hypothetical protein n=1 Tax=Pseudoalteromonas sp. R86517 TaxID=3093857 RepID=UPI00366C8AD4